MKSAVSSHVLASDEVSKMVHAFDDQGRKQSVRILAERVRQLENELRYCLIVIESNLDCSSDIRITYAKSLIKRTP